MTATDLGPGALRPYWDAVSRGDKLSAIGLALELVDHGVALPEVLESVVAPAQAEVGRRWARNEWTVAQEHRATSIGEEVVSALARLVDTGTERRGTAIVSCVEGEWHSFPSRLIAVSLASVGWDVHYLGASVPAAQLSRFVQDVGPEVVALSCSLSTWLLRARWMIEAARDSGVPVIAGGPGFGPGGKWALALGANGTAAGCAQAMEVLGAPSWPAFTGPAARLGARGEMAEHLAVAKRAIVSEAVRVVGPTAWDDGSDQAEDVGQLVDSLTSAVLVGDEDLLRAFAGWMIEVRVARGENRSVVEGRIMEVRRLAELEVGPLSAAFGRA